MKTLNEVIKANECCDHGELDSKCEDCPYNGIGACCAERETDVLYYLKTIETTENLYHDAVNKLSKWEDEDWKDRYLPLTWDELKQMRGKPVWVVRTEKYCIPHWAIVEKVYEWDSIDVNSVLLQPEDEELFLSDQGKIWQVYRKERNETN